MSITLSNGVSTLNLNPDLMWSDEYTWNSVQQTADRTITGALIVSATQMTGGRPITLQPEDDSSGWTARADVDTLRNWAAGPGTQFQLTLRGVTRNVMFRLQDGPGVDAKPVVHFSEPDDTDYYLTTLRFMEV